MANDRRTPVLARRIAADLEGCACVSPPHVAIPYTLGAVAEVTGDPTAAIAHYQRALAIERRPEIYLRLGLAQLEALDRKAAIESFVRAGAFDPSLIGEIPYKDVRSETRRRIEATYPAGWIR
jgi:hypothetical protein